MKKIVRYEIIDHGIEHEQYFQGCGISGTSYTDCATGIGDSFFEALEDAADQLAQQGFEMLPPELEAEIEEADRTEIDRSLVNDECHYYASILIKADDEESED